jgi:putative ABC transport system permease protein
MWVDSLVDIVDRFSFLTHFLWMVDLAGVLILVGTIAMLAVEERYAEVAIRRAEGARVSEVVMPLLGEGITLALVALPIGYGLALWILEQFVQPVLVWEPRLPQLAIYGTPVLLLLVGIATNLLPARRVARISPARVLGEHGE